MTLPEVLEWVGLGVLCLSAALAASAWMDTRNRRAGSVPDLPVDGGPVFLLDGEDLVDASPAGRALTADGDAPDGPRRSDLATIVAVLGRRFRGLDEIGSVERQAVFSACDPLDAHELLAERLDDMLRLEVRPVRLPGLAQSRGAASLHALEAEYDTLRNTMDDAPYPIWRVDDGGEVSWYNHAYGDLFRRTHATAPQPGQRLFQSALDTRPSGSRIRASVSIPGEDNFFWYDVWITRHDGFRMFYAVDVGAVVNAEIAQRNFVQTLTKTFAQLSIGLAIFDRNRQLALFNPALIDLTGLPADFLSARPNLLSFFDRLRDARMMPEPKDYSNWRERMADLVAAAADGRFQETWTLPSGSIYQVSGRPHPDGAVAFLLEDITAEVTLTRRFRLELEMSQSILDRLDDAVAVFGGNGVLTLSNAAYRQMWCVDPEASFADVTIQDATRDWADRSLPTPVWGDLRDFVAGATERESWWAPVTLKSGAELLCKVHPVPDGATMVVFRASATAGACGAPAGQRSADAS